MNFEEKKSPCMNFEKNHPVWILKITLYEFLKNHPVWILKKSPCMNFEKNPPAWILKKKSPCMNFEKNHTVWIFKILTIKINTLNIHCNPSRKSNTGQHLQFLRCLVLFWLNIEKFRNWHSWQSNIIKFFFLLHQILHS